MPMMFRRKGIFSKVLKLIKRLKIIASSPILDFNPSNKIKISALQEMKIISHVTTIQGLKVQIIMCSKILVIVNSFFNNSSKNLCY